MILFIQQLSIANNHNIKQNYSWGFILNSSVKPLFALLRFYIFYETGMMKK